MEGQSEQDSLSGRRQELIDRANERGIDWESAIEGLSQDIAIIYTLATLLGLDIWDALDVDKPLSVLEREAALMESGEQSARMRFERARRLQSTELDAQQED